MLIFDNILFNSFIPQVAMGLIYLYCCVSMVMSNVLETQDKITIHQDDAVVYQQTALTVDVVEDNTANFIDFSTFISDEAILTDKTETYILERVFLYPTITTVKEQNAFQQFSFSRPPPFLFTFFK